MPPAIRPNSLRPRRRLKRTQWRNLNDRLKAERDRFATPLNDLSFDDRNMRVRILMQTAYRMGRRDQAELEKLRRAQ